MTDEEKNKLVKFEVRRTVSIVEPVYPDDPDYDSINELYEDADENLVNQT